MRKAYVAELHKIALKNDKIIAVISDNGAIIYDKYREELPGQYVNFGISESNMLAASAGMASCGLIPFVYTISNFMTMRAYEFIRNDICLNGANVKIVGTGAGFAYSKLGATHHATEDIALMRALPGLVILSPASPLETRKAVAAASGISSPVYIRIGTGNNPEFYEGEYDFRIGRGVQLAEGTDATIIATGTIIAEALSARDKLKQRGISARVVNMHTIQPIDRNIIEKAARETGVIVTLEEHSVTGGLGDAVGGVLLEAGARVGFRKVGINGFSKSCGDYAYMKRVNGIDGDCVVKAVEGELRRDI